MKRAEMNPEEIGKCNALTASGACVISMCMYGIGAFITNPERLQKSKYI